MAVDFSLGGVIYASLNKAIVYNQRTQPIKTDNHMQVAN